MFKEFFLRTELRFAAAHTFCASLDGSRYSAGFPRTVFTNTKVSFCAVYDYAGKAALNGAIGIGVTMYAILEIV